jgi:KipI family sensor histidine kinase inhibitor
MTDQPLIRSVGLSGVLVTFAEKMEESANRAALAFRAAVAAQDWPEVIEVSTSLVSTFVEVDLATTSIDEVTERLRDLLGTRDWSQAPLPKGRKLWHVPCVYGTDLAPQLEETAALAGVDPDEAIRQISTSRVRVLTIGFAPGQPYMGELSETWNIPRQEGLTPSVPPGSLVIAIRQLIIFTAASPTGWRHIGQTAWANFRPDAPQPFALSPGDELIFPAVSRDTLLKIKAQDTSGAGGATSEALA